MMAEIARKPVNLDNLINEGGGFCHCPFSVQNIPLSHWTAPGHDRNEEGVLQYPGQSDDAIRQNHECIASHGFYYH